MHSGGVRLSFQRSSLKGMPTMYAYKSAQQILDEYEEASPEHAEKYIDIFLRKSQEDPDDMTSDFEALVAIFDAELLDEDQDPNRDVMVPLGIIQKFGHGLSAYLDDMYRDAVPGSPPCYSSLEQRLGLRSSTPGERSHFSKKKTVDRNMKIALEVAQMIGPKPQRGDVEEAIKTVKEKRVTSKATVVKAWSDYGAFVLEKAVEHRIWDRSGSQ
jgi:hypothetical protein